MQSASLQTCNWMFLSFSHCSEAEDEKTARYNDRADGLLEHIGGEVTVYSHEASLEDSVVVDEMDIVDDVPEAESGVSMNVTIDNDVLVKELDGDDVNEGNVDEQQTNVDDNDPSDDDDDTDVLSDEQLNEK